MYRFILSMVYNKCLYELLSACQNLIHLFFYKQSIFDPRPENCLSFSEKSPQKIV